MLTPIGSTWLRSHVSLIAIVLAMGAIPSAVRSAEPEDAEAEAALKRFADRLAQPSGDRAKLREEILDFRLKHPGTALAARASGLLSQLRSPLDKLDPANIPPLARFPSWQPKELVGVVGEHRGRHAASVSAAPAVFAGDTEIGDGPPNCGHARGVADTVGEMDQAEIEPGKPSRTAQTLWASLII